MTCRGPENGLTGRKERLPTLPGSPASLVNICCPRTRLAKVGQDGTLSSPADNSLCPLPKVNFRKEKNVHSRGEDCCLAHPLYPDSTGLVYKNFKQILCALCWQRVRKICYLSFWLTVNGMGSTASATWGSIFPGMAWGL